MTQLLAMQVPNYLVIDAADAQPILAAIARTGQIMKASGWGIDKDTLFTPSEERPTMHLIDSEQLKPRPEPVTKLMEEKALLDKRWYEQYTAAEKFRKERDELQKRLDNLKEQANVT